MSYKTTIEIGVVGIGQIGLLQKSLNQVATTVDVLNKKQVTAGFNVQNLNTYNNLLQQAWQNINKAAMGSQEELQAVRNLVEAKNNQIAAQTRLNSLIAREELMQKKIVATANAGFGVQGPALPPSAKPKGPAKGSLAFNPNATAENLALGAGFPLLFGGGAGQVLGGLAGSFFGGGFGGQILGSALGQILEDAQKRIAEIGNATKQLNVDNLRSSVIYVNAELDTTIRRLIEAGKAQEAVAVAAEAVTNQSGMLPKAVDDITRNVNVLGNTWNQFTAAISGTLSLLGAPFVQVITLIISGWTKILQYANLIGSSLRAWGLALLEGIIKKFPILQFLLNNVLNGVSLVTEEEQRRGAALQAVIDKQSTEIANNAKNIALEKQRTLGRTTAEKQINIEVERGLELNKINAEYDARKKQFLVDNAGLQQAVIDKGIVQIEQLRKQAIDQLNIKQLLQQQGLEIEANKERYATAATAIELQIAALERAASVRQSALSAEAALNDLYGAQLDRAYRLATTAQQRYDIAVLQFNQQVNAAQIEYKQAVLNNKLLVDKAVLQAKLIQLKYEEIAAEKEIALAQAVSRGNTPDQISSIAGAYNKALSVQSQVVQSAYQQVDATKQIAENQNMVARAVYQTKILQAESALTQKLVSTEIGLSQGQAQDLAANMAAVAAQAFTSQSNTNKLVGTIQVGISKTQIFARSMSDVAAAAATAAYNIRRAFIEQLNLNAAQSGKSTPKKAADGAFWQGGFKAFAQGGVVNRPTLGLIGEGGESEYIVPESKAAGFATNYLFGQRGEAAIPSTAAGADAQAVTPVINITTGPVVEFNGERYVTVADMERAMRMTAEGVIGRLRTPSARIALGMA